MVAKERHETDGEHDAGKEHEHDVEVGHRHVAVTYTLYTGKYTWCLKNNVHMPRACCHHSHPVHRQIYTASQKCPHFIFLITP